MGPVVTLIKPFFKESKTSRIYKRTDGSSAAFGVNAIARTRNADTYCKCKDCFVLVYDIGIHSVPYTGTGIDWIKMVLNLRLPLLHYVIYAISESKEVKFEGQPAN